MSTRPTATVLAGAALFLAILSAEERVPIRDPVRDYLNDFETQPDEQLISTQVDLNGDGVEEIFLSRTSLYNGRQGNIWVLYESLPGGLWKRHETLGGEDGGVIEFHPKAVSVQADGKGGKMLIRYSPGSASSGRLTTLQLRNGGVSESERKGEIAPLAGDAALYDQYFSNPESQLTFALRNMAELRAKYLPFNRWFHEITLGKLVFLLICVFAPLWVLRGVLRFYWGRRSRRAE